MQIFHVQSELFLICFPEANWTKPHSISRQLGDVQPQEGKDHFSSLMTEESIMYQENYAFIEFRVNGERLPSQPYDKLQEDLNLFRDSAARMAHKKLGKGRLGIPSAGAQEDLLCRITNQQEHCECMSSHTSSEARFALVWENGIIAEIAFNGVLRSGNRRRETCCLRRCSKSQGLQPKVLKLRGWLNQKQKQINAQNHLFSDRCP
jgi:hypothetical protein